MGFFCVKPSRASYCAQNNPKLLPWPPRPFMIWSPCFPVQPRLDPHLPPVLKLQAHWPCSCFSYTPSSFLAKGNCPRCSLCLDSLLLDLHKDSNFLWFRFLAQMQNPSEAFPEHLNSPPPPAHQVVFHQRIFPFYICFLLRKRALSVLCTAASTVTRTITGI